MDDVVETMDVLTLLEELIEAHLDTIEILNFSGAHESRQHAEYLQALTRAGYATLARHP